MEQTAVEWLILQIEEKNNGTSNSKWYEEIYEQAKEMEKQQIIDAHLDGQKEFDLWR